MKSNQVFSVNNFGFYIIVFILAFVLFSACADFGSDVQEGESGFSTDRGGTTALINLPFPSGKKYRCVQGARGSFSHQNNSTKYDIDFDTPNDVEEEVFAPVSGRVYVHTENPSKNFGNHVNIDLGNGTYVVVAHLSKVLISSKQDVEAGELIGIEGCSGYCTGDHVHIGLHSGAAGQMAEKGTSLPARYLVSDATTSSEHGAISGEDLVCGIASMGDSVDGHFYTSSLAINMWHPNGTLVKTANSNKVYLLAQDVLHWIESEAIFWSFGYRFDDVVQISQDEMNCYGKSNNISHPGLFDAFTDMHGQIWLVVGTEDTSQRYRIRVIEDSWEKVLGSYGLEYSVYTLPSQYSLKALKYLQWPVNNGLAMFRNGTLVKEKSRSDVYVVTNSMAVPIKDSSVFRLLGYSDKSIQVIDDGSLNEIMNSVGSCSVSMMCLDLALAQTCGGSISISDETNGKIEISSYEPPVKDSEKVTVPSEPEDDSVCGGEDVCISNSKVNTKNNALFFRSSAWTGDAPKNKTAYVYGIGSCFDGVLDYGDTASISSGWYMVDFSKRTEPCAGILTLISNVGTDGDPPKTDMSNWYWWQNSAFCKKGSSLCQLMKNNTSWEEWLVAVSWNPETGLVPAGNGFTSNKQLK